MLHRGQCADVHVGSLLPPPPGPEDPGPGSGAVKPDGRGTQAGSMEGACHLLQAAAEPVNTGLLHEPEWGGAERRDLADDRGRF